MICTFMKAMTVLKKLWISDVLKNILNELFNGVLKWCFYFTTIARKTLINLALNLICALVIITKNKYWTRIHNELSAVLGILN